MESVYIGVAVLVIALLALVFTVVRLARKPVEQPQAVRPYVDLTGLRTELDKQLDIAAEQVADADRSTGDLIELRDDLTRRIDERELE